MMLIWLVIGLVFTSAAVVLSAFAYMDIRKRARFQKERKDRLGVSLAKKQVFMGLSRFLLHTPLGVSINRRERLRRCSAYERDLPACLEVIALGMQAGMGFDQAFGLYAERFDTPLAHCCQESLIVWQKGLKTREEGMWELADMIDTVSFRHFTSSVLRALRFGAPMTQLLLDLANESRKEYRARKQELVAKAPVKMLLPTGTLILPAMLLLVMGPIVLDLMRRM